MLLGSPCFPGQEASTLRISALWANSKRMDGREKLGRWGAQPARAASSTARKKVSLSVVLSLALLLSSARGQL